MLSNSFNKTLTSISILSGLICIIFAACNTDNNTTQEKTSTNTVPDIKVPAFNADSAYTFTQHIVDFGPRIPGTTAQKKCFEWVKRKCEAYGAKVYTQIDKVQIYTGKQVPMMNIVAAYNPECTKRLLLLAHSDTRPWSDRDSLAPKAFFDGADDAATGMAQLLEIARNMAIQKTQVGIDILFTDVEDYGPPEYERNAKNGENSYCLGTQYWTHNPHVKNYHAFYGILLDMTGAQNASFYIEGKTQETAGDIADKIWTEAANAGYSSYFIKQPMPGIIDDHVFVNRGLGIPCVDIIYMSPNTSTSFAPHWHTQKDNMKIVSKETLRAVGQTVMNVVYKEQVESHN